jgi:hypothetical protein
MTYDEWNDYLDGLERAGRMTPAQMAVVRTELNEMGFQQGSVVPDTELLNGRFSMVWNRGGYFLRVEVGQDGGIERRMAMPSGATVEKLEDALFISLSLDPSGKPPN